MTTPRSEGGASVPLAVVRTTLDGLVHDGVLSSAQADQVTARLTAAPLTVLPGEHRLRTRIVEIAGYLGGAMVLGGAAAIVVPTWDSFPPAARFVLAVTATILLGGGAIAARFARLGDDTLGARLRLASALGTLAAGAAAIAVAVPASDANELLVASIAALVVALPGYALVRGAPLLATAWVAGLFLIGDVLERAGADGILVWGVVYAIYGALWMLAAMPFPGNPVKELGLTAAFGGLTGLGAAEAITTDAVPGQSPVLAFVGLFVGLVFAAACFGLYLATRRWPALVPAVLIALVVPATALAQILDSVLAAGFAVALVGLALLVAGAVALVHHRPTAPA